MSELSNCFFCKSKPLVSQNNEFVRCVNIGCKASHHFIPIELWQRVDLEELAKDVLKQFGHWLYSPMAMCDQPDSESIQLHDFIKNWKSHE